MVAVVLVLGIGIGSAVRNMMWQRKSAFEMIGFDKLDEVMRYIDYKYVDDVKKEKLTESAINQILSELDPHSVYIPRSEYADEHEALKGSFDGVGIEFKIIRDTVQVMSVMSNSPSETAGILQGDKIIRVNNITIVGDSIDNKRVKQLLKGKRGTSVQVSIVREGNKTVIEKKITRSEIKISSIENAIQLNDSTLYIKINQFTENTYDECMDSLKGFTISDSTTLIIDLRNNPGGYLSEAIKILDEMVDGKKLLLYTQGNNNMRKDYFSKRKGLLEKCKIAVLINSSSASASEIIAGAIQDLDRGVIIGETSFGKGLVQEEYRLSDGSSLRLTIARYFTPSGRCIQRPYNEGKDEYYAHAEKRMLKKDSVIQNKDTTRFYTLIKRRLVKASGGVTPDILALENNTLTVEKWATRQALHDYVLEYVLKNNIMQTHKTVEAIKNDKPLHAEILKGFLKTTTLSNARMRNSELLDDIYLQLIKTTIDEKSYYHERLKKDMLIEKAMRIGK